MNEYDDQNNNIANRDNKLVNFSFEDNSVRIVDNNGKLWFVLADVLKAMGSKSDPYNAKRSIEQGLGDGAFAESPILDSMGRQQTTTVVSEPAVTYLIARSNTEISKRLNRWIHIEVIPSIKETGSYSLDNNQAGLPKLVNELKEEINLLKKEVNNINKYNVPNTSFTLTEIVYYINDKYGTEVKRVNNRTIWDYLKEEVKMIKSNNVPYVNEINNKFIIVSSKNNPFLDENDYGVLFTRLGLIKILDDMKNKGYIN